MDPSVVLAIASFLQPKRKPIQTTGPGVQAMQSENPLSDALRFGQMGMGISNMFGGGGGVADLGNNYETSANLGEGWGLNKPQDLYQAMGQNSWMNPFLGHR